MSHARHQSSSPRKSMRASEPLSSLDQTMPNGAHSLAHELAVALMPEPGGGSRMLAEEFGIEYDEGAEGIDENDCVRGNEEREVHVAGDSLANEIGSSLADEMGASNLADELGGSGSADEDADEDVEDSLDEDDGDDSLIPRRPEQDAMEILAQNLASTDQFLAHLRAVDAIPTLSSAHTSDTAPSAHVLERLASDMIRAINEATKERESQVRELIAYEREFRRLSTEVGGNDVLCELDDIDEGESDSGHAPTKLDTVAEEDELDSSYAPSLPSSPQKPSFAAPQPSSAAAPLPHLVQLRTHTAALLSSLTTISEQAQVNGAATADSGRRIRALKNRFGGLRGEWEGAERSRGRIERWEREGAYLNCRRVAEEHMIAFQQAIDEAGVKTQAIMAR
ncbi:uncharacterized protein HD556DRAFT_1378957 [Suillus plorans]|uniref:Uncharacterized protein n=1 Tax=Suillus plorans TaxID=116603 RepID=A0A9P7DH45_9AGAM|nr:uncharacterized protein HD556DRAFT_1378957 [Suillus plorans]KAG1792637.1 hypothetical protein HD556DRAFT_1378957 [Suillus plorans]KAG1878490.1 hypothetical protein C8R48DRAFT_687218 [Suillus tomentosus]